ncbi:uncharacterized mitochondrial protein-like protein [Tanacetum coccineum]
MKSTLKNINVIASGMCKVRTKPNQTRTPQLPRDIRKTNKRVSFSTGVIPTTSVSRPQLKSNQIEDRVLHNNSQGKKQQVEDHRRNFKFSNNKTSVTACNDSLNAKTSNVNFVCVTCGKCVLNDNHDMCVLYYINGVNSRFKKPIDIPISTREPNRIVNQSTATPLKKTVAAESTNQKPRNKIRKQYEHLVEIILFIVDSGCSKHMTGNLKLLSNFVEKFLVKVKFKNDQIAPILGYGDLVQRNVIALWKSTFYIRDLKGNDLLTSSRGSDLYSITLQDTFTPNLICLMAKATSSQAWLWHRRLSHLNFNTINLLSKYDIVTGLPKLKFVKDHLCSSCDLVKAKHKSFKTKTTPSSKRRLQILHMDLCGPMRVESFNVVSNSFDVTTADAFDKRQQQLDSTSSTSTLATIVTADGNFDEDIRRSKPYALVFYDPQRNPNEPPRYLYNKDLFFLKYGNSEERKYVLSLHKIHAVPFLKEDLEENMNRWVRKEFKTFNEEERLSIQHWKDSWHKTMYKINHRRVRDHPEEYLSNHRIVEVVRVTTEQQHGLDYMEIIIMMRENDKTDSFSEADFKYLNNNDIKDMYYLFLNKKVNYRENKLLNSFMNLRSIARSESITIHLAYACAHDFKLYQMDVKSAF